MELELYELNYKFIIQFKILSLVKMILVEYVYVRAKMILVECVYVRAVCVCSMCVVSACGVRKCQIYNYLEFQIGIAIQFQIQTNKLNY